MEVEIPPTNMKDFTNQSDEPFEEKETKRRSCVACEDEDLESSIHGFNTTTNITVVERPDSDSGVEVVQPEAEDCVSLISCCSTYEAAYDLLARKNSTLLEDLKLSRGDSEGGSESSSVTGSTSSRPSKRLTSSGIKKKVAVSEPTKSLKNTLNSNTSNKTRSRPITPRTVPAKNLQDRSKSKDRNPKPSTPRPSTLKTSATNTPRPKLQDKDTKKDANTNKIRLSRSASTTRTPRTPVMTPTDDGRWPSAHKNNIMTRSLRGSSMTSDAGSIKSRVTQLILERNNTLDKYATLPRRRKEKSADNIRDLQKPSSRDPSVNRASNLRRQTSRESTPGRSLPPYPKKKPISKTRIYHEVSAQTCLTIQDVEKALAGIGIQPLSPHDVEKVEKEVQVGGQCKVEKLEAQLQQLQERYSKLAQEAKEQKEKLIDTEQRLNGEKADKQALKEELQRNFQRVQTILGNTDDDNNVQQDGGDDSLLELESRFQAAGHVIIKQENEISELHSLCRSLQRDLEKSIAAQKILLQQQQELEAESAELQEFLQAEKSTLGEALSEAEARAAALAGALSRRDTELAHTRAESATRRREALALAARLGALESRSRDLLLQQGGAVSGAAVALAGLSARLDAFATHLIRAYGISDQALDDVIFHNEAYSPDADTPSSPSPSSPSPQRHASFVSALLQAIRTSAATSTTSESDMLDSETEPCLMMESVLEDVALPDTHSHNLVSATAAATAPLPLSDTASLVDQVIDADNLLTKLLKVLRIVQLEQDGCVRDLQAERVQLTSTLTRQRDTAEQAAQQLRDWETLGARLKAQLHDIASQLASKARETDELKADLHSHRQQIERLNQDVCALSTACSQSDLQLRLQEEQATRILKEWQESGQPPSPDVLSKLIAARNEAPGLVEKMSENEAQLAAIAQQWRAAAAEARRQYNAIDTALETLHSVESVVAQCPALAQLQRDLEETSFHCASTLPLPPPSLPPVTSADLNANATTIPFPINGTA